MGKFEMGLKGEPADSLGDIGGSASVFNAPVHAIEFKHTLLSDKISDNPMMISRMGSYRNNRDVPFLWTVGPEHSIC